MGAERVFLKHVWNVSYMLANDEVVQDLVYENDDDDGYEVVREVE